MSTKTLRKRIALVAVASLGFGLMSTVPASAATSALTDATLSVKTGGDDPSLSVPHLLFGLAHALITAPIARRSRPDGIGSVRRAERAGARDAVTHAEGAGRCLQPGHDRIDARGMFRR